MVRRALRALVVVVPLVATTSATSREARADDTTVAAATVLFDDAVKLMDAGRYLEACPKLAKSQALAPSGGTLLALAECHEKSGKVASAWVAYREAATRAASAGKRDAEAAALEHAKSLQPRLPRLTVSSSDAGKTNGLEVRRDGVVLKDAELGVAVPIDPGPHEIVATAPDRKKWLHTVSMAEGATVEVAVPPLETDDGTTSFKPREPESPSTWHRQKTIGLLVAGVGLAGVVVGSVFGAKASSTNDEALRSCPVKEPTVRCDARGLALTDDAQSQAMLSTVFVIVGAAALVGGGVLFFTAPSGKTQSERSAARFGWAPVFGKGSAGAAATLRW